MVDATIVTAMSKIFDCEDPSREVPDATREAEADKDKSDATREVEPEVDDDEMIRAASMVAERMFASAIKTPNI